MVVDDAVDPFRGSIHEADAGGVDVPELVGPRGADANFGSRGIEASARAREALTTDLTPPGGGAGDDEVATSGEQREARDGEVAQRNVLHEVAKGAAPLRRAGARWIASWTPGTSS